MNLISNYSSAFLSSSTVSGLYSNGSVVKSLLSQFQSQASATVTPDLPNLGVSINKTAIQKNLWNQLEKKVKNYEALNPGTKGNYVVAIKQDQTGNIPSFRILNTTDVVSLMSQSNQKTGTQTIADHPVQVFSKSNTDSLTSANQPGLSKVVSDFLKKNASVFSFLNSAS
jgi:hypothetical protein